MKKIDNFEDLNTAIRFINSLSNNDDIESIVSKLPECLKESIQPFFNKVTNKAEVGVYPKNLSIDIFSQMLLIELSKIVPNYKTDKNSIDIIHKISSYATRDESFLTDGSMSFEKGLLIMGNVGCGKTVIIMALSKLLEKFPFYIQWNFRLDRIKTNFIPVYKFVEGFTSKGYDIFSEGLKIYSDSHTSILKDLIFIDDIGAENIVSNYGNTVNVIGEFIIRRYDTKLKTFATTNLDPKTLKTFYGERVYSRMVEMFNFIVVDGGDRRH